MTVLADESFLTKVVSIHKIHGKNKSRPPQIEDELTLFKPSKHCPRLPPVTRPHRNRTCAVSAPSDSSLPDFLPRDWLVPLLTREDGRSKVAAPAPELLVVGGGEGDLKDADNTRGREEDGQKETESTRGREEDDQADLEGEGNRWLDARNRTSRRASNNNTGSLSIERPWGSEALFPATLQEKRGSTRCVEPVE
ncbi:hypothetical protein NDU88_002306 [Pleurodeles waltl]|uniref:Uncharacterized protein n=1 Tax=Pleurodeles waltl TaxID=8319 RepID=A0AAV7Q8H7_PLEWA|nr:hypothetical protein NDU88_002306 [Pleurodeles waltl]